MSVVTEEFDSPIGQFVNYDTNDVLLYDTVKDQKHIDLRSFTPDIISTPRGMIFLVDTMTNLDTLTMASLDIIEIDQPAETWVTEASTGTVSFALGFANNRSSLNITFATAGSIQLRSNASDFIDFSSFNGTDYLSLALPAFPNASINNTSSYIKLESRSGAQVTLTFQSAESHNVSTDYELRWALFAVPLPDIQNIVLNIVATASCVVKVNAMRILPVTWTPFKTDIDTRLQRLSPSVDRFGAAPTTDLPHLWRSSATPGPDDPKPFNTSFGINFYTGALTGTGSIKLFLRGRREDFLTQLDLDGTGDGTISSKPSIGENQWSLEQSKRQPDYGQAVYNPREQEDLDTISQDDLDTGFNQAQLERISDIISQSWIEITLTWTNTATTVTIGTTETLVDADRYIYTLGALTANTAYILLLDVEDNSVQVRLTKVTNTIDYANLVLDTHNIINEFIFPRRKGRVGYLIDIGGVQGAWVDCIRSRGLMFGEVITNSLESITPVSGAQIYTGGNNKIINDLGVEILGAATIDLDTHNSRSDDGSWKVTGSIGKGLQTTKFLVEDFPYTEVHFDLYYPQSALSQGLVLDAGILGPPGITTFILPEFIGDQWQHCRVPLIKSRNEQTGSYRFFLSNQGDVTWWVDNLRVIQYTTAWSGRAITDDAWDAFGDDWVDFRQMVDSDTSGALFDKRGKFLQVRGQTLTDTAVIDKVYIKPKYAELGRFSWDTFRGYR